MSSQAEKDDFVKEIFFPHDSIRKGQEGLIKDAYKTIGEGKNIIANAPTGIGKTASALSVAVAYAHKHDKKVFFLTNRHTQHTIAIDTLKEMSKKFGEEIICADMIGKRFMCNQEVANLFGNEFNEYCKTIVKKGECDYYNKVKKKNELTVEAKYALSQLKNRSPLHNEELQNFCRGKDMCSYEMSVALAKKATVIIGDYYYMFNPVVASMYLQKLKLELDDIVLVIDEAHNLPDRITSMMSTNLTTNMLKNAILEAKKFGFEGLITWLDYINTVVVDMAQFEKADKWNEKEKIVSKDSFLDAVKKKLDYKQVIEELEEAADTVRKKQKRSNLGGVAAFLENWKEDEEGFVRIIAQKEGRIGEFISLQYLCLDPSVISRDIFSGVHSSIIMSATLEPTKMYKDLLGIDDVYERSYPSPFPAENKLSLVIPETTTKFSSRSEQMYLNIAQRCAEIVKSVPGSSALFFPSYHLRDKIAYMLEDMISGKKIFWEKQGMVKEEKEELLSKFKQNAFPGAVLFAVTGANFAEGVDFPGDLLKAVVVIGIPLAKPDLKTKETIAYYDKKFSQGWNYAYTFPAINKCIQSAGRCIRSSTDRGVVVYLGERFAWQNYFNYLPREGLRVTRDYKNMIDNFFKK